MTNWFADKLGGPQQVQRYVPPPHYAPQQPQPQPQQQTPQGSYQQQQATLGQITAAEAVAMWQGTAAAKQGSTTCPKCGGPYDFTFSEQGNIGKVMNKDGQMVSPLPRCFTCGYNGRFEQIGQQATDLGAVIQV